MTVAGAAGVNGTVRLLSPGMGVASTVFSCKLSRTPRFRLPAFAACNMHRSNKRSWKMHPQGLVSSLHAWGLPPWRLPPSDCLQAFWKTSFAYHPVLLAAVAIKAQGLAEYLHLPKLQCAARAAGYMSQTARQTAGTPR